MFLQNKESLWQRFMNVAALIVPSSPPKDFDFATFEQNNTKDLRSRIRFALNCESAENGSNTPDWILADYLLDCLATWDKAVQAREKWYGSPINTNSSPFSPDDPGCFEVAEPNVKRSG